MSVCQWRHWRPRDCRRSSQSELSQQWANITDTAACCWRHLETQRKTEHWCTSTNYPQSQNVAACSCQQIQGTRHTQKPTMILGSVAYRGSLRRRSVVMTAGSLMLTVSNPPSTSRVTVKPLSVFSSLDANVACNKITCRSWQLTVLPRPTEKISPIQDCRSTPKVEHPKFEGHVTLKDDELQHFSC